MTQVMSTLSTAFLLILAGLMMWVQDGLKPVLRHLQGEQVITAYIQPDVKTGEESKIIDSIRTSLGAHPASASQEASVRFFDTTQFTQQIKTRYPELAQELEELGPEAASVVPRFISITGVLADGALADIRSIPGIETAETSKDRYLPVIGAFVGVRRMAKLLLIGISLALLTGLLHLARMNDPLLRDALSLLKLWGASGWTLRVPGLVSGLSVGLAGGAVAALVWIWVGSEACAQVIALSPVLKMMPPSPQGLAGTLLSVGAALGLISGSGIWSKQA